MAPSTTTCRFVHTTQSMSIKESSKREGRRQRHKKVDLSQAMMKDTGEISCSFEPFELDHGSEDLIKLTDYQFIASYNWSKAKKPSIFVPGCPPLWTPPTSLPIKLPKDKGKVFLDQNAHRSPTHSFDPFFKSLLTMHPSFNMNSISLVCDRNSFRNLFGFASNNSRRSFRIDVDIVYNTMFLTRWERKNITLITGFLDSGYGHEFEKVCTTFDKNLVDSSGHHRIVQYNLGGISCLVRYEADAYLDEDGSTSSRPPGTEFPVGTEIGIENDISANLKSLSLTAHNKTSTSARENGVGVIEKGRLVAPGSVIELKTRSQNVKMKEVMPQLWFSQTEHLFVGYHHNGIIEKDVTKYEMTANLKTWESQNQEQLRKLVSLILKIRAAVQETESKRGIIVYDHAEKPRRIKIYNTAKKGLMALLDEEKKCWN